MGTPFGSASVARTDACGQPCDEPMLDSTVQPRASLPCRWHSPSWSAVPPEARQTGRATTAALPAGKPQRRRGAAAWLWPCLRYRSHEGSLVSLLHGFELLVGPWGALSAVAGAQKLLPAASGAWLYRDVQVARSAVQRAYQTFARGLADRPSSRSSTMLVAAQAAARLLLPSLPRAACHHFFPAKRGQGAASRVR